MKKKEIIISVILCVMCFVIGLIIPKYGQIPNSGEVFEVNGVKVIVNSDNENTKKYIDDLSSMPDYLCKNVEQVVITNADLNGIMNLDAKTKVRAVTVGKKIYINNDDYNNKAVMHELFHVYDVANGWVTKNDDQIVAAYAAESGAVRVSPGNVKNVQEFFATVGEMYFSANEELQKTAPKTYEYLKTITEKEENNT